MTRTADDDEICGRYREIRAVAQDLRLLVESTAELLEKHGVTGSYSTVLTNLVVMRGQFDAQVGASLDAIEVTCRTHASQRAWCGDYSVHIANERALLGADWTEAFSTTPDTRILRKITERLDRIVFFCASLTVTPRLNDILSNMRVGQTITFEAAIGDELPQSPELRDALCKEIIDQDGVLAYGFVDRDQRVIYRVARTVAARWWSILWVCLVLASGLGLVVVACHQNLGPGWPFTKTMQPDLIKKYVCLIFGAILHFAVQGIRVGSGESTSLTRPSYSWVTWLNAHETQMLQAAASLVIIFGFMSFAGRSVFTWTTAFFAGYSFDSLIDLVLDRFGRYAAAESKRTQAQIQQGSVVPVVAK